MMAETNDNSPETPEAETPRVLDIRITAARDSGFIVHDMTEPEGRRCAAAFTDWRDCLEALGDLLSALPGESPAAPANGNGRTKPAGLFGRR